jgi:hypothetical protein
MKTFKKLLIIPFLLLLQSCATQAKYQGIVNSYLNQSSDILFKNWGAPNNSVSLSDGGKIVEYYRSRTVASPNFVTGGTILSSYDCKTTFTINNMSVIIDWKFVGNDCVAK